MWKNRCAATQRRIGGHSALVLSRWNASEPPEIWNLVLLTQAEAAKLEEIGQSAFPPDIAAYITAKLRWAKQVLNYDESSAAFASGQGPAVEYRCVNCQWRKCRCGVNTNSMTFFRFAACSISGFIIGYSLCNFGQR